MSNEELTATIEAGDLYSAMLIIARAWLERDHPDVLGVTLVGDRGDGFAAVQIPITRPVSASSLVLHRPV